MVSSSIENRNATSQEMKPFQFGDLWRIEGHASLESGLEVIRANNRNWAEICRYGHIGRFNMQEDPDLTHGRMMLRSVVDGRSTHDSLYNLSIFERLVLGRKEAQKINVEPLNTLQYWKAEAERLGQSQGWARELYQAMKVGKIAEKVVLFDKAMDVIDAYLENDPYEFVVRLKVGLPIRDRVAPLGKIYADRDEKGRDRPGLVLMDSNGSYGLPPHRSSPKGLYIEIK